MLLLFSTSILQAAKILVPKEKGHLNLSVWQNKLKLSTVGTRFFLGWSLSAARMGNGKLFPSRCVWRWVLKSQWIILFVLWRLLFFNRHCLLSMTMTWLLACLWIAVAAAGGVCVSWLPGQLGGHWVLFTRSSLSLQMPASLLDTYVADETITWLQSAAVWSLVATGPSS